MDSAPELRFGDTGDGIERIDDVSRINELLWSLSSRAAEVLAVHPVRRRVPRDRLPRFIQRLENGASWRTIVPRALLEDAVAAEYCQKLHEAGDRHRVTDETVQQMIIIDRRVGFVPAVPNASAAGALMIQQPGAVATLADLFERVWTHATDLGAARPPALCEDQMRILRVMTTATKDDVAARQLGMGLRTYRRHVAALLESLNATNRVQAVLAAKDRGWL
ncbi:hypothetical protein ACIBEJ_47775 [Nonomuraea sp. NPDC050790]|uniref:hypothetical protein n=1 Tax=Nonomuraea sp. NPDC050790 TaxID=3364371 RepID=UPI0037B88939